MTSTRRDFHKLRVTTGQDHFTLSSQREDFLDKENKRSTWAVGHSHTLRGQAHLFFSALPHRPFLFQSNLIVHADLGVGMGIAYFWAVQSSRDHSLGPTLNKRRISYESLYFGWAFSLKFCPSCSRRLSKLQLFCAQLFSAGEFIQII